MMSVWKRLKKWEKAYVIGMTIFLLFSTALYIRDYNWALDEAYKSCNKGYYDTCQYLRNWANSRIRSIFITLIFYSLTVPPIIGYRYRKAEKP